ncbi:MAG: ferrochelatase [Woeseiaceae bacterium]|nr:ferrochelatase [Woeseiaceae bacterium]
MPTFQSSPYEHGQGEATGILLVNLGTPDAPTPSAVRRFLAEFLWDPRVIELPRPLWWLVLHGVILRIRPARSARAYQKIWTEQGSPLMLYSQALAHELGERLGSKLPGDVRVALGMSYGTPSIASALEQLHDAGVRRLLVLPLYPQYSGTTTASVFDAVTSALRRRRWVPEFRFIGSYHDAPGYIDALSNSIRDYRNTHGAGEKLLFSFHGVPRQTLLDGDPYHCQCQKTARLVAEALDLRPDEWLVTFQSRVGRAEWLRPYTDETIEELGKQGMQSLDVVCPGFATDCLETLEEIAMQNAEIFTDAGGGSLNYIPALNASSDHVAFLSRLVEKNVAGWPEASDDYSAGEIARERTQSRERAIQMGAAQ